MHILIYSGIVRGEKVYKMIKKDRLIKVQKIAEFLSVSPKTIRKWAKEKILPGIKIGPRGDWRFTLEDIQKMIKRRREVKSK